MASLNDIISQSRSYRVKWRVEKPIALWEQSDIILDGATALKVFKEKIDTHSSVLLVEERALASFAAANS